MYREPGLHRRPPRTAFTFANVKALPLLLQNRCFRFLCCGYYFVGALVLRMLLSNNLL